MRPPLLLLLSAPVAALAGGSPVAPGAQLWISTNASGPQQQQQDSGGSSMGLSISSGELIIVGLLILLILVSIVGNCLVCVAIFTDRRLRKLGNAFIVSLAIADLFVSCLVMTFALCNDLMNYWIFGDWFCDVWISFDIMCCTASILNLCAISLDRFIHIKDCLLYNQWMTRRVAISAVIVIWFISALVSFVPINLGWHKPDHQFGGGGTPRLAATSAGSKLDYSWGATAASSPSAAQEIENQSTSPLAARHQASWQDGGRWANSETAAPPEEDAEQDFVSLRPAASGLLLPPAGSAGAGSSSGPPPAAQFNQVESNPQDGSQIGKLNPTSGGGGSGRNNATAAGHTSLAKTTQHQQWPSTQPVLDQETGAARRQLAYRPHPAQQQQQHSSAQQQQHAQCMLTLTPTYAIISSTISFYIPCIIMLGLYTKLFACARRHVRNIQAISKAPAPIAIGGAQPPAAPTEEATTFTAGGLESRQPPLRAPLRTWLKLGPRPKFNNINNSSSNFKPNAPNAQTQNDKLIKAQHNKAAANKTRSSIRTLAGRRLLSRNSSSTTTEHSTSAQQQLHSATASNRLTSAMNDGPNDASDIVVVRLGEQQREQLPASDNPIRQRGQDGRASLQRQMDQIEPNDDMSDETGGTLSTSGERLAIADNLIIMSAAAESAHSAGQAQQNISSQKATSTGAAGQRPRAANNSQQLELDYIKDQQQPQHDSGRIEAIEERRPFLDHQPKAAAPAASVANTAAGSRVSWKGCGQLKPQGSAKVNFQAPNQQQSGQLATHKAAVTLGIIMGTFLFCWVPFFCLNIIKAFCVDCIPSSLFRAFTWLGYANSALNPIIYGIHNSEFRNAFNRIFFKHLNIKNSRYYLNRRFSYDQRHPPAAAARQQNCHTRSANQQHKTLKSDAVT